MAVHTPSIDLSPVTFCLETNQNLRIIHFDDQISVMMTCSNLSLYKLNTKEKWLEFLSEKYDDEKWQFYVKIVEDISQSAHLNFHNNE